MKETLRLENGDIHLWITRPEPINDPGLLKNYRQLLTDQEKARVDRYRFEKDRHSGLVTRAFVRDLLSHYADRAPQDWRFEKGEKDKPEIVDPPLPLRFNLSHTQGLIACAVTLDDDIGCDVEYLERNNDILGIADRYFSPSEVRELFSLPEDRQRSRFFDYWTLKESYIKAWGLGLAIPLDDFSFHIQPAADPLLNDNIRLSFAPHRIDHPELWHSWLLYPNPTHRMALSVRSQPGKEYRLKFFASTPLQEFHAIKMPF